MNIECQGLACNLNTNERYISMGHFDKLFMGFVISVKSISFWLLRVKGQGISMAEIKELLIFFISSESSN